MANAVHNTSPRISSLIRDPFVRAAFMRAEKDTGGAMVLPSPKPTPLKGGFANRSGDAACLRRDHLPAATFSPEALRS